MQFGIKDIVLTVFSILLVLSLALGGTYLAAPLLERVFGRYGPTLTVVLFVAGIFFFSGLYGKVLRAFQPYREGTFAVDTSTFMTFWKYYQFNNDWTMSVLGYVLPVSVRAARTSVREKFGRACRHARWGSEPGKPPEQSAPVQ